MRTHEEQRNYRKYLKTEDQDEAMRVGIEEHANIIDITKSGRK